MEGGRVRETENRIVAATDTGLVWCTVCTEKVASGAKRTPLTHGMM